MAEPHALKVLELAYRPVKRPLEARFVAELDVKQDVQLTEGLRHNVPDAPTSSAPLFFSTFPRIALTTTLTVLLLVGIWRAMHFNPDSTLPLLLVLAS